MEKLIEISRLGFKYPKPWLHITFDDGYQENLDVILPIIKRHKVPITVFVSTNHIEKHERFYSYTIKRAIKFSKSNFSFRGIFLPANATENEREKIYQHVFNVFKKMEHAEALKFIERIEKLIEPDIMAELDCQFPSDEVLSIDELKLLSKENLVYIGSHSHDHLIINEQTSTKKIHYQMACSKEWIVNKLGKNPIAYCYPNGTAIDFTITSKKICRKYYEVAFTTIHGFINRQTDVYEIPRVFLLPDCTSVINRLAFPKFLFGLKLKISSIGENW